MAGIRRVADLGTNGVATHVDGSIQTADIAANAITQAKMDTATPLSGLRNAVINGNFDIWQRGTPISTDAAATQIYTADRWAARALFPGNSSIQTISRETSTSHIPTGSRYSLKSVIGTSAVANNGRMQLCYSLETADSLKFAGKQMTLSFKIKGIQNIDRIYIEARYNTTEGRTFDGTLISNTNIAINTSSFTTCSFTFTVPSAATLTSTGNIGFVLTYSRAAGTEQIGDGIYLSQVQLEEGSQVTPFEQRPYGIELSLCQRYFVRILASEVTNGTLLFCRGADARPTVYYQLPTSPRATGAQITESGTSYVSNLWTNVVAVSGITQINTSPSSNIVSWCWTTWSSLTAEKVYIWNPNGSNVSISMEL